MIHFNVPYSSPQQPAAVDELIKRQNYAGGGYFNNQIKTFLNIKYGFKNVYLTTSCTAAIELCAMALDFNENDEVIIPSYTFPSTPTPFIMQGCKIVFADSCENYPNMSLNSIQEKTTANTKAVMVVHYGGFNAEIEAIKAYCTKNNFLLIEDAAQSIHAFHQGKPLGSFGDLSVFSFHETKNIHCGEGGMLVVNNPKYLNKLNTIYQYGTNRFDFLEGKTNHYEWVSQGLSFTLSEINCAFLYPQLLEVDQVTAKRKALWQTYKQELWSLAEEGYFQLPSVDLNECNAHTFYISLKDPLTTKKLMQFMKSNKVQCVTHYYPLHLSRYAQHHNLTCSLPNTEFFGNCLLRLPLHHELTEEIIFNISSLIQSFFENH